MKWIVAYATCFLIFGMIDAMWLSWSGPNLYRPVLGSILADEFRLAPAALFYLAYVAAVVWFAVQAGMSRGIGHAAINGAILGAIAYGTYDLTNQATMKVWATSVTIIDIAWGSFATALSATITTWVVRRMH
ncbi:DUF2177 family protein [Tsuneonella mangrovi]|uniref:DUF2177 family protein n=1 Tax=Tsuneonella mangrovi TaxID=1982042 RepID=UPI000BA1D1C9|nr:DUF2177 family protein [Tsuneonella mangrovi]